MLQNNHQNLTFLENLPRILPNEAILRRLGYQKNLSEMDSATASWLQGCIRNAASCIRASGIYTLMDMEFSSEAICLKSMDDAAAPAWEIRDVPGLNRLFSGSARAWVAAVTIGNALGQKTVELFNEGKGAEAAVFDAVGSECADAAMDSLQSLARQKLSPLGLTLSPLRFSPGYGGWTLQHQKFFFLFLDLGDTMHLSLNDACIITPEKSITAIAPVFEQS